MDDDFWSHRIVVEANEANGQEDKEKEKGGQAHKVDGGHKKEEEATDPNTGHEDGEGLVTSPVDFQLFSFVGGFQSFFGIGKGQGVTIEVGPVAMDKVHQSFLEIDQKD